MIQCKVRLFVNPGNYPHSVGGVSEEELSVIRNFLNSVAYSSSEVGYSPASGGDSVNDAEWKLLYDNAGLLGIEFIVEGGGV